MECNKGEYIPLELIENNNKNGSEKQLSAGNWQMKEDQRHVELQLKIEEPKTERIVNILRAEMQCIDLPKEADSGKKIFFFDLEGVCFKIRICMLLYLLLLVY